MSLGLLGLLVNPGPACGEASEPGDAGAVAAGVESGLQKSLAQADEALRAGQLPDAFAQYLSSLDAARSADDPEMWTADDRLEELRARAVELPETELDAIQARWPAWDTLRTADAKAYQVRFLEERRKKALAAGNAAKAETAAETVRDAAWRLLTEHPWDPVARETIRLILEASEALGNRDAAKAQLARYAASLPPCPTTFCVEYWAAQDAQKAGDAAALKAHCRRLLNTYEAGALDKALADPLAGENDRMLMDYHVAYANYVVERPAEALEHCDYILKAYGHVKNGRGEPHGTLAMTALLRAMSVAAMKAADPARGVAAYDEFLARYPDDPNAATALLNKGALLVQLGDSGKAAACFDEVAAEFPESDAAREADARRAELEEAQAE